MLICGSFVVVFVLWLSESIIVSLLGTKVSDLPFYEGDLVGSEGVLSSTSSGTRLIAYPRLWKPATRLVGGFATALLATGAVEQGVVTLAVLFEVVQVTLSQAARLRLYSTVAARLADADRLATIWAQAGIGLILEVLSAGPLVQNLDPHAFGASLEVSPLAAIPYSLQNLGAVGSVTVGFTFIDRS